MNDPSLNTCRSLAIMGLLVVTSFAHSQSVDESAMPVYKSPVQDAPVTRVSGTTRGVATKHSLNVLAPERTGLTAIGQPVLYWHATYGGPAQVEIVIVDEEAVEPLFEDSATAQSKGFHAVALEEYGVELEPGVEYQWSVTLIPEKGEDFNELFASGTIKRVEPARQLIDLLKIAKESTRPVIYAEQGYWYVAITGLSQQIEEAPDDLKLRKRRAHLLEQVGLKGVAEEDLR